MSKTNFALLSTMAESKKNFDIVSLLPLEMQVNIFQMLTTRDKGSCALVCKEWNSTVNMLPVWRDCTFEVTAKTNLKNCRIQCERLAARGIRRVKMTSTNENETNFLYEIALTIPNLVHLKICGTLATDGMLELISRNFTELTHITLMDCNDVTDVGIAHLTGQAGDVTHDYPRLEFLKVGLCPKLTNTAFQYISLGQPQLKYLSVFDFNLLSDPGLKYLSKLSHLEKLSLIGDIEDITDQGLCYLAALAHLKVLHLRFTSRFTIEGIHHLQRIVQLHKLVIRSFYCYHPEVRNLLSAIPHVHSLSFRDTRLDDLDLEVLCSSHLRITKLEICFNGDIHDEGLKSISLLSELLELKLMFCFKLTGSGLAHIAEGNKKLISLNLYESFRISSALALEHIVKMKQLRTLIWYQPLGLTEDELTLLSKCLPRLQVTQLNYYPI